jgi:hypothetical protein
VKKSLAARGENCVIAIVEGQLDFDGAVVLQFGCSVTEISSPLSNPLQWKKTMPRPYLSSAVALTAPKGELGPALIADLEMGRLDEIEIVAVPKICLDDPPSADQFAGGRAGHGSAAISLGVRTKL